MGVLYPDNKNRNSRVQQLASDIAHLQTQIRETVADAEAQDKRTIEVLDKVAKQRGYKTLDEYVEAALQQLTPEEKEKYHKMNTEFASRDAGIKRALKIGTAMTAIGLTIKISRASVAILFQQTATIAGLRAVGIALIKLLTGQISDSIAIFRIAFTWLSAVWKGEGLVGRSAKVFKALSVAGTVLSVLGVALDGIFLIYDIVDGSKQRSEFQQAIKDLCVRRLTTKKIQEFVRVTLQYSGDAKSIVTYTDSLQDLVKNGTLSQENADREVAAKLKELEPKVTKAVDAITDEAVYQKLQKLDQDSKTAWTNEDPTLDYIVKKIEEEAAKAGG